MVEPGNALENLSRSQPVVGGGSIAAGASGPRRAGKESPGLDPVSNFRRIGWADRAGHNIGTELCLRPEKLVQPLRRRDFVVINKGDEVRQPGLGDSAVARISKAAPRLDHVPN